jgi:hypothetical protein
MQLTGHWEWLNVDLDYLFRNHSGNNIIPGQPIMIHENL